MNGARNLPNSYLEDPQEVHYEEVSTYLTEVFGSAMRSLAMVSHNGESYLWNVNLACPNLWEDNNVLGTERNLNRTLRNLERDCVYEVIDLRLVKVMLPLNRVKLRLQFSIIKRGDLLHTDETPTPLPTD